MRLRSAQQWVVAFLLSLSAATLVAGPQWSKLENCTLVEDGYHDGDSFLVRIAPDELRVFRLYFVDTPEDSNDRRYPERIADQARYFRVTTEQALALGDEASSFTSKVLSKPFVVWTCWQKAPGASSRQRYYAMIEVSDGSDGRWLISMLVESGLARIYGKRITLPCGTSSRDYLALLEALEDSARRRGVGGWER